MSLALVGEAHSRYKTNRDGKVSQVYPALARTPEDLFGICIVGTRGNVYATGDADYPFTIMSVSKPFVFALVDALDLYTRQCSLDVSARDLAVMGATLADGGINPLTKERVVDAAVCHYTLAVMATAGLYETSGDWLYDIGLPGKSGVGGGIVTVSPGKGGLGTFAPLLDAAGNSVKGQLVAKFLSQRLGMDLFVSAPDE
jgi:glutaminase